MWGELYGASAAATGLQRRIQEPNNECTVAHNDGRGLFIICYYNAYCLNKYTSRYSDEPYT
jgi:hypothetical protein